MRVMFAVGSYWPSQDGVAHITEYLAEGLADRNHEVLVLTSAGDGGRQILPAEEYHEGVCIKRMRIYVQWPLKIKGRDDSSTLKRYLDEINSFNPDVLVVVCAQTWTLDWIIPYLDDITCKKIFYSHGFASLRSEYDILPMLKRRNIVGAYAEWKKQRYYGKLYRSLLKFDRIIHLSTINNSYVYCTEHGISGEALENAIQEEFVDRSMLHDYANNSDNSEFTFLYIANYNPNKNQEALLRAFYKANLDNSRLVFAGFEENDYLRYLRELAEKMDASRQFKVTSTQVTFNTHLSREEIFELYRCADVFVSTSKSENSPIVHREAAACGMPVISFDVGDVSELEGIILVKDECELAVQMRHLATDRGECSKRGEKLRHYMETLGCTVSDKVTAFENMLLELI